MVKGISRQVIVVPSPDKKLFDQAIFILKDDAVSQGVSDDALLAQAQQRLDELAGLTGQSVKWESIADKPGLAPSLALKDGQLAVVTAAAAEQDNPLPITSAAVHAQLGQVNALLASI